MSEKKANSHQLKEVDFLVSNPIVGKIYTTSWAESPEMSWVFKGFDLNGAAILETPKSKREKRTSVYNLREKQDSALINMEKRFMKEEGILPKNPINILEPSLPESEVEEKVSTEPIVATTEPSTEPNPGSHWSKEEDDIILEAFKEEKVLAKVFNLVRNSIGIHRTGNSLTIRIAELTVVERYTKVIIKERAKRGLSTVIMSKEELDDYVAYKIPEENIIDEEIPVDDSKKVVYQNYVSSEEVLNNYAKSLYTNPSNQIETPERERLVRGGIIDIPFAGLIKSDFVIKGIFVVERQETEKPKE